MRDVTAFTPRVSHSTGRPNPLRPKGRAEARSSNAVVLALVVALLDLEQRRDRGKVRPPMTRKPAA